LMRMPSGESTDAHRIAGEYRSESTGTALTILRLGPGLRMNTAGSFGSNTYELECLATDVWRARSISPRARDAVLTFGSGDGSCRFSSERTRALHFQRVA